MLEASSATFGLFVSLRSEMELLECESVCIAVYFGLLLSIALYVFGFYFYGVLILSFLLSRMGGRVSSSLSSCLGCDVSLRSDRL